MSARGAAVVLIDEEVLDEDEELLLFQEELPVDHPEVLLEPFHPARRAMSHQKARALRLQLRGSL